MLHLFFELLNDGSGNMTLIQLILFSHHGLEKQMSSTFVTSFDMQCQLRLKYLLAGCKNAKNERYRKLSV